MKRNILCGILFGLFITGCTVDDDYVFDESATTRIQNVINKCSEELVKPEYGWKMLFEPNKERLGGFNVLMKFQDDGTVDMVTDFLEESSSSTYSFNESQGAVLNFDSYSCLHYLADPRVTPVGTGMEGEFEFVIYEITSDSIVFKGKKYGQGIVFYPAEEEDWNGKMDIFREHLELMSPQEDAPFFRGLTMNQTAVNLVYDPVARYVTYTYSDDKSEKIMSGSSGVSGTEEGVKLSTPISVNGVLLDELMYNTQKNRFETNTPGVIGTLKYSHKAPFPFYNSYNQFHDESTLAGTPRIGGLSGSVTGMMEFINAIMGGHAMYMSSEMQMGYRELLMAGVRQVRIVWELNYEGKMTGPWLSFFGANTIMDPEIDAIYSINYKLELDTAFIPATRDQIRFKRPIIREVYRVGEQFSDNIMTKQGVEVFYDFLTDPAGFTIVPSVNNRFYLVNQADSRRWILLTKE